MTDVTKLKRQYAKDFATDASNASYATCRNCALEIRKAIAAVKCPSGWTQAEIDRYLPIATIEDELISFGVKHKLTPIAIQRLYTKKDITYLMGSDGTGCFDRVGTLSISQDECWTPSKQSDSEISDYERSAKRLSEVIHTTFLNVGHQDALDIALRYLALNESARVTQIIEDLKANRYELSKIDDKRYLVRAANSPFAPAMEEPTSAEPARATTAIAAEESPETTRKPNASSNTNDIDRLDAAISKDFARFAIAYLCTAIAIALPTNAVLMPISYQIAIFLIIAPLLAAKAVATIFGWQTFDLVRGRR